MNKKKEFGTLSIKKIKVSNGLFKRILKRRI